MKIVFKEIIKTIAYRLSVYKQGSNISSLPSDDTSNEYKCLELGKTIIKETDEFEAKKLAMKNAKIKKFATMTKLESMALPSYNNENNVSDNTFMDDANDEFIFKSFNTSTSTNNSTCDNEDIDEEIQIISKLGKKKGNSAIPLSKRKADQSSDRFERSLEAFLEKKSKNDEAKIAIEQKRQEAQDKRDDMMSKNQKTQLDLMKMFMKSQKQMCNMNNDCDETSQESESD